MSDLLTSIQSGDVAAVRQAIANGVNVNKKVGQVRPLEAALGRPMQPEIAKLLIQAGADASKVKGSLCAVIGDSADPVLVQALLDAGADPNMDTPAGLALDWAIRAKSPQIVRLLIEAGADVNATHLGRSPLFKAVDEGEVECALALAEAGAQSAEDDTSLPLAVHKNMHRVVEAMLRHGANPNARGTIEERRRPSKPLQPGVDVTGLLAGFAAAFMSQMNIEVVELYRCAPLLHIAAGEGHLDLIRLLLNGGADSGSVDDQGATAAQIAERNGQTHAVQLLRELGAAGPATISADLALLLASEHGDITAARSALDEGAAINTRDQRLATKGMMPLMLAASAGQVELVRWLLVQGAEVAATDSTSEEKLPKSVSRHYGEGGIEMVESAGYKLGRTALMYAAAADRAEVVRVLIDAGADVNGVDLVRESALILAASAGGLAAAQALVEAGADIDQRGHGRHTPLMNAVVSKQPEMVVYLLSVGANPNLKTREGDTAVELARKMRLSSACIQTLDEAARQRCQ